MQVKECSNCRGSGKAYRFEDRDCIEGYKLAVKKVCLDCNGTGKIEVQITGNKNILVDCDGVLLDWETTFHNWVHERGYGQPRHRNTYNLQDRYSSMTYQIAHDLMTEFNRSAAIGFLTPLNDAKQGVSLLASLGYRFTVITAMGGDSYSRALRRDNLTNIFGDVFIDVIFSSDNEDKTTELSRYTDNYWIEDNPTNYETGRNFGLKSILLDHPHNRWYNSPATRANNWKDICSIIGEKDVQIINALKRSHGWDRS